MDGARIGAPSWLRSSSGRPRTSVPPATRRARRCPRTRPTRREHTVPLLLSRRLAPTLFRIRVVCSPRSDSRSNPCRARSLGLTSGCERDRFSYRRDRQARGDFQALQATSFRSDPSGWVSGRASDDSAHCRIVAQAFRIVDIFISSKDIFISKPSKDGLIREIPPSRGGRNPTSKRHRTFHPPSSPQNRSGMMQIMRSL